jgi:autonomous glycyl radical cofactor GrcA
MTENTLSENEKQAVVTEIEPFQLTLQVLRLRKANPRLDLSQNRIARELNRTQSAISKAMSHPEIYPDLAERVQKYLNRIESSRNQLTQNSQATA